jgi:CubicO group peptidase (beta-lactamase class C family)
VEPARFDRARDVLRAGLDRRAFPAAAIEVGRRAGPLWQEAFGHLTYERGAAPCTVDTIFDLASLTKVVATTSVAMQRVASGTLTLETPVSAYLPRWHGGSRESITIRHLLDHSSGLPAHARLWERTSGRAGYLDALVALPLERPPATAAVYSDPGFLVLGFVLDAAGGGLEDGLATLLPRTAESSRPLRFNPPAGWRDDIAPTEHDAWRGRLLQGEVHDENAAALGGVAPHAGLFGSAPAVGAFARLVLQTFQSPTALGPPSLMRTFATRSRVPGSSRALGWDTMLPTSSCGTRMSPRAIGHTGFTGTSLWIDPELDLYVVLLTNRVHPTRENNQLAPMRGAIHDAVMAEFS